MAVLCQSLFILGAEIVSDHLGGKTVLFGQRLKVPRNEKFDSVLNMVIFRCHVLRKLRVVPS